MNNEGITSPGGMTTNDSTSPIHGYGEGREDDEADYDDEYQAMVDRVRAKAKEQEKRKPVDIDALARRLRAADTERGIDMDEDIMESRLYQMRKAGYDIL